MKASMMPSGTSLPSFGWIAGLVSKRAVHPVSWVVHFSPCLLERFNRRNRAVTRRWRADEIYVTVRRKWMYLHRAIDSASDTIEFWISEHRNLPGASGSLPTFFGRRTSSISIRSASICRCMRISRAAISSAFF